MHTLGSSVSRQISYFPGISEPIWKWGKRNLQYIYTNYEFYVLQGPFTFITTCALKNTYTFKVPTAMWIVNTPYSRFSYIDSMNPDAQLCLRHCGLDSSLTSNVGENLTFWFIGKKIATAYLTIVVTVLMKVLNGFVFLHPLAACYTRMLHAIKYQ